MIYRVSIYKDKAECLIIVPYSKDEKKNAIEINKPIILEPPYDALVFGEKINGCFKICIEEPFKHSKDFEKVYEIITGAKSYSNFSKDRLSTIIFMDTEKGFTILPLKRFSDGSYRPIKVQYPPILLNLDATDEEIGESAMKAFEAVSRLK